jgi:hypothetical protein
MTIDTESIFWMGVIYMSVCIDIKTLKNIEKIIERGDPAHKVGALETLRKWKTEELKGCDKEAQILLDELLKKYLSL